mgnify:CR=1 FL=1
MKRILSGSIAAAMFLLSSLSGCVKTEETFHYVKLSQVACSFDGDGNTPLAITVETSPAAYEITPGDTWVKAEKSEEDNTLILTVADNDTGAERSTVIIVTAGSASREITVQQLTRDNRIARYRKLDTFSSMGGAMSPSGKYVGGFSEQVDENDMWYFTPIIIDTETGEKHEFGPYPQSLYALSQANAITDQGLLFISDGQNGGQIAIDLTGNIFIPEAAGYTNKPEVSQTSSDGKYWVGYIQAGMFKPLLWTEGTVAELPMPALNYRNEEFWAGVLARGISANGEIIYGTSWENDDCGMLYWKNNGTTVEEPRWVGDDIRRLTPVIVEDWMGEYEYNLVDGCICTAETTKVSPSGKWIATTYRKEEVGSDGFIAYVQRPAFYNTETETTTVVEDYGEATGMHVTDDGIAFIGIGMFRYTPHPILHNVFARGLPCLMSVLMIALPWLAPQLSKVVYVISDLAIVIGALAGFQWLAGRNTLTNVEALAGMMFLGWFIIFSRQIAAIESDRVQTQLILAQSQAARIRRGSCGGQRNRSWNRFPTLVGSLILVTVHEHSPQTIRRGVTRTDGTSPVLMAIRNRSSLWWAFYRSSATGSFSTAP